MRTEGFESLEDARAAGSHGFGLFVLFSVLCISLVFVFAVVILRDAEKRQRAAVTMMPEMHDMTVSEEDFRSMLWFRLMEECVEREPEYACILKVDKAVEIAVSARWKAGVRHSDGNDADGVEQGGSGGQ